MTEVIWQKAAEQGMWAVLFVGLFYWVLRTNNEREQRYITREERFLNIIQTLSNEVKDRLQEIEDHLLKRR